MDGYTYPFEKNQTLKLPYTIEQQLQAYSLHEHATERHRVLWHAWNQNKGWLTRFLELTLASFPTYSRHDATHAQTVLHNIELVLGAERIQQLSATDCFLLLHVVYVHDIGMCITADDRKSAVESDAFQELVDHCEHSNNISKMKWAATIKQFQYAYMEDCSSKSEPDRLMQLYIDKLDVYHAMVNLLTEYIRDHHGERGMERLLQWTTDKEKLGAGFSFSGIPNRIFSRMAECASLHTASDFSSFLHVPQEDSGYAHDCMHPRFIAVLLQLGDALDLDNDRFHPFVLDLVGQLPETSEMHFQKHSAIRMLQITPDEINITADCSNVEVLHLIRKECGWIEDLLKNASYYWQKIVPSDFSGCLPYLNLPTLRLDGIGIPQELVTARFSIPQEKAFQLLEGANVYGDYFPFLRELLQNAIDATKLQYWSAYRESAYYQRQKDQNPQFYESTFIISQRISPTDYPIEIFLKICPVDEAGQEVSREFADSCPDAVDYGVLLEIQDHGVGITQEDILEISRVGTSHSKQHRYIREMPDILKPTGEFGIGLQSLFTVAPTFSCDSHAANGEAYHIVFSEASRKNDGIINASPLKNKNDYQLGSRFRIFISRKYKIDHHKFLQAWSGIDYFTADYEYRHRLHEAEELMAQIIYYLQEILGEELFPICVIAEDDFSEELPYNLQNLKNDVSKFLLSVSTKKEKTNYKHLLDTKRLHGLLSWGFQNIQDLICPTNELLKGSALYNNENLYGVMKLDQKPSVSLQPDGDRYFLDPSEWKLYIWCEAARTFACFSADRFLNHFYHSDDVSCEAKLFYKGIKLHATAIFRDDLGLIEYLDIKHGDTRQCLQLNRDQLTEEGRRFLQEEICPAVLRSAYQAMKYITNKIKKQMHKKERSFLDDLHSYLKLLMKQIAEGHYSREDGKALLSLTLLAYFAKSRFTMENGGLCRGEGNPTLTECPWEKVLQKISESLEKMVGLNTYGYEREKRLEFLFVRYYGIQENSESGKLVNIASLLSNQKRYYIYSVRQHRQAEWQHRIISATPDIRLYKNTQSVVFTSGETNTQNEILSDQDMEFALRMLYRKEQISTFSVAADLNLRYSSYIAKWMLHNIATEKAMAYMEQRTDSGDSRLNLLTTYPVHEISFNNEMLYLLLKKMEERNKIYNAQRFSTVVWSGFACLQVQKCPTTVCQINRGYFSQSAKPEMLLPLRAADIQTFLHLYEEFSEGYGYVSKWKTNTEFINRIKLIVNTVNNFQELLGADRTLMRAYEATLESRKTDMRNIDTLDALMQLNVPKMSPLFKHSVVRFKRLNMPVTDALSEEERKELLGLYSSIQSYQEFPDTTNLAAWLQYGIMNLFENEYLQDRRLDELKEPFYDRNAEFEKEIENLIAYIQENGVERPPRERIIDLFLEIYDRLADAVRTIHKKEFIAYLKKECGYTGPIDKLEMNNLYY